ncbi:MAG: LLM class flavin-dependent oxidoreductase [Candidatus Binataceae bacterium]|jgi:alkanesulfonate monooxygenase SsuD/methylene tetrahydromethanopterin reductase-like flavin-dependent oxidoreductase (luciferase family)
MRFGLGPYELGSDGSKPLLENYEQMLEQAAYAEELGFDSVWVGESHFGADGACPSSETAAAAIAVRTKAVRIGVMPVLALANPLYVAEDVAVLDSIAKGRVIVAAQKATAQELAALKIGEKDADSRFAEALKVALKSWAPTSFAHDGDHWRLPGRNFKGNPFAEGVVEINVTPKPAQLSVPVWIAARDNAGVEQAAKWGFPWLASPVETFADIKARNELYRKTLAASGRMLEGVLFPAVRELYMGESMQEAKADAEQGVLALYQSYHRRGLIADAPKSFDALARDRFIIGDVDHVTSEIDRYQREAGVNYLILRMSFPGVSQSKTMAAIKFFGEAVVPEFRMASFPSEIRKRKRASAV